VEQYPVDQVDTTPDHIDVRIAVATTPWIERLLLRLGPDAEILEIDAPLPADLRPSAAARVLERYQR